MTMGELMVVLAIVLILVTIAVATYVRSALPKTRVVEAEQIVQQIGLYARNSTSDVSFGCEWSGPGDKEGDAVTVGKDTGSWAGIDVGDYHIKADGEIRCAYALCEVVDKGAWALAVCDADGDGAYRYYAVQAGSAMGPRLPSATDGVLGLVDDDGSHKSLPPSSTPGSGGIKTPTALVTLLESRSSTGESGGVGTFVFKSYLAPQY